jgi:uncharacterized protein YjdB
MMTGLRIWLLAVTIALIGCGGHVADDETGDADSGPVDASRDRDAIGASDGAIFRDGDAPGMNANDVRDGSVVEASSDRRPDAAIDTRDAGTSDTRDADHAGDANNTRDAPDAVDAPRDVAADIFADIPDVSVDRDAPSDEDAADAVDAGHDSCAAVICGLVALRVTPPNPTLIAHMTRWMWATGEYVDGTTRDVTNDVLWSTSQPEGALVSNVAGRRGLLTATGPGLPTITATLGTVSGSTVVNVATNEPRRVQIRPSVPAMAPGTERKLTAMVTTSDGSQVDWSAGFIWSSSASSVATVSAEGVVTGLAPGTTTITATFTWLTDSTTVTITPATLSSLSITPGTLSLPVGLVQPLRAIGQFSDGTAQDLTSQATWSTSDASRVTVGDEPWAKGKITGVALGSATVTASFGGISATAAIDVSSAVLQSMVILRPPNGRLMLTMDLVMLTQGRYSDGSTHDITHLVTWTSADPSIIEARGQTIFARGEGTTEIVGTCAGVQGSQFIEVRAGVLDTITISPAPISVAPGASVALYATGTYTDNTTYDLSWLGGWNMLDTSVAWIESSPSLPSRLWGANVGTTEVSVAWAGVYASGIVNVTTLADASSGD